MTRAPRRRPTHPQLGQQQGTSRQVTDRRGQGEGVPVGVLRGLVVPQPQVPLGGRAEQQPELLIVSRASSHVDRPVEEVSGPVLAAAAGGGDRQAAEDPRATRSSPACWRTPAPPAKRPAPRRGATGGTPGTPHRPGRAPGRRRHPDRWRAGVLRKAHLGLGQVPTQHQEVPQGNEGPSRSRTSLAGMSSAVRSCSHPSVQSPCEVQNVAIAVQRRRVTVSSPPRSPVAIARRTLS